MHTLLRVTQYNWSAGQSVQLFTGHVVEVDDDGNIVAEHEDRLTTIGVDHRPAAELAELINDADFDDSDSDYPLAAYEPWQVLA